MQPLVGVDIGGTSVKIGVVRGDGGRFEVVKQAAIPTQAGDPGEVFVRRVAAAVRELLATTGLKAAGVGLGCPGLITPEPGVVRKSPNLPNLMGFPLREQLAREVGLPVEMQNDANAAVLGEYLFGPNRGTENLILLTLGTGVGGGAIVDGRLLLGADNAATEFGHLIVEYGGARCACGKLGCIEAYAGAAGISRIAGEMMGNGKLTSREVAEMARQGDRNAEQVLHTVGGYLGRCMGTLIDAFNPATIVVGGGASAAFDLMLPGIREGVEETCSFAETRERTRIERSAFSDEINIIGAAAIYLNLHRS